jgi:uroporphyrinogen-III decarboxylase
MTSRERLLAVLHGQLPDCVPVCPDISNMVPARLTGKPFWDIYVYQDPPLWKAYIDACKCFDIDGGFEVYQFGDLSGDLDQQWVDRIAHRPHVHSCGPETALVKMAAEETHLTVVDPLEIPPMGDWDLAELKRLYGDKIVLKGNLHTTRVMLHGTVDDVIAASKRAIDDAAAGGSFILSTGDQSGRDTPDENLRAMVEVAHTYGKY